MMQGQERTKSHLITTPDLFIIKSLFFSPEKSLNSKMHMQYLFVLPIKFRYLIFPIKKHPVLPLLSQLHILSRQYKNFKAK